MAEGHRVMLAGRFAEGIAQWEEELKSAESRDPTDMVSRACLTNSIGFAELQLRRPAVAAEWLRRGLELHPLPGVLLARLTHNLASAHFDLKQMDAAEHLARRAMAFTDNVFGSEHPETQITLSLLAGIYFSRSDYARAEPIYRRVLYLAGKSSGPLSYTTSLAAGNLAMIYLVGKRFTQAQALFEQSLAGLRVSPMKAGDAIPLAESGLALSYVAAGRVREGTALLDRLLVSAEADLGPTDPTFAIILERAANAKFIMKDHNTGAELFERAIQVLENHHGSESPAVLNGLERYAGLLRAAKDKGRAKQTDARRRSLRKR